MDCPISDVDAFIFEGYLCELKKALRSVNRPLAQICKKVETDLEMNHREAVSTLTLRILSQKKLGNLYHVQKLKYLNFEVTVSKPNNVVSMSDGSIVEIQDLICSSLQVDATKVYLLGQKLEMFLVIEICEAKNNPIWENPFVLVPTTFLKPQTGDSIVRYPSPPYSYDDTVSLQGFVESQAIPPPSWEEKKCIIHNVAANHQVGLQMLTAIRATKKTQKKRSKAMINQQEKNLVPLSTMVTKVREQNNVTWARNKPQAALLGPNLAAPQTNAPPTNSGEHVNETATQNLSMDSVASVDVAQNISIEQIETDTSNISEPQNNIQYVVMSKDDFLGVIAHLEFKIPQIIGKVIEQKVIPRFDTVDENMKQLTNIAVERSLNKNNILTFDKLKNLHNLSLPLLTSDQFLIFDYNIRANTQEIRSNLKKFIISTTSNVPDCMDNVKFVVERFISNEILCRYTSQRPKKDPKTNKVKPIFKMTAFSSCLFESFLHVYTVDGKPKITDKVYFKGVGNLINIARTIVAKSDLSVTAPSTDDGLPEEEEESV
ncbi:hypothetical protein QAD02_007862 [Eretmocerus hayati]|uniref:Uncharacterized protein n=1 Tax=Eretmocerus hayati TaxID=131215 RepID=A0ACC2N4U4_9HYME|nr:hypothetical protein QAD02_007862 [Eretmocerus hayati]